jgi:ornithine cyclodeaminase/alanine dehydrogenase-like protein (mu-crystallin family)
MQINTITVTAGRTFNHPHEQYSNLRPEVVLTATLAEGDVAEECARALQAKAEGLVEDHKQGMLRSIEELYQLSQHQAEVRGLEAELKRTQQRLEEIRTAHPTLKLTSGEAE